jgi:hypothetical protein
MAWIVIKRGLALLIQAKPSHWNDEDVVLCKVLASLKTFRKYPGYYRY